jgi:O-antigen biosynthesis protein
VDTVRDVKTATMSLTSGLSAYSLEHRPGWRVLDALSRLRRNVAATPVGVVRLRNEISNVITLAQDVEVRFPVVDTPVVSVVIPVYNNWLLTKQALASLILFGPLLSIEVIVVDDASTDSTHRSVAAIPGLRVIPNETNLGFTRAANRGARAAHGAWTLFLNNDTIILPGCVEALITAADSDPSIGAVGARLAYPSGWLQEVGGMLRRDGRGWHLGHRRDPDDVEWGARRDVDYCSAAALMVRSSLLLEVGYFDERYAPAYYEDTDLCFELRKRGFRTVVEPAATVVHWEGMTHGTDRRRGNAGAHGKANQEINRLKFIAKWGHELASRTAPALSGSR